MQCRIFNVEHDDLPFVLNLNNKFSKKVGMSSINKMVYFLDKVDYFKRIELNSINVGFLIAISPNKDYLSENYRWFNKRYQSFTYIDRIVISKEYQGQGYGRFFYDHLCNHSKENSDHIACEVNTRPLNQQSIRYHEKYGFYEVGKQETENGRKCVSLLLYDIDY